MSSLDRLSADYADRNLRILLINLNEERDSVATFMQENGHSNTVLLDSDGATARSYQVVGIPLAFLIDRDGIIVDKLVGEVEWEASEIRSKINELL